MQLRNFYGCVRQISSYIVAVFLATILFLPPLFAVPGPVWALNTLSPLGAGAVAETGSFVTKAVDRVGPAVVRIDTERTVSRRIDPLFDDPFFRQFWGQDFRIGPEYQQRLRGQGSGFIITSDGTILTNAHVVKGANLVTVTLQDGRTLEGRVTGTDEVTDLAVVKIKANNLPVAPLGDSSAVRVGDWAIALGNPLGLDSTVTLGIISTLKRSSAAAGIPDKRLDFIQTDAAINPGNSGGPLLNAAGEVIGINTAIRAGATGIGFAIPINTAKQVAKELAAGRNVPHPFLGIQMVSLTPELARENNNSPGVPLLLPEITGALITGILPDTPAAKAGLKAGDIILEARGVRVQKAEQLQDIVEATGVGQPLPLKIQRHNQTLTLTPITDQLPAPNS